MKNYIKQAIENFIKDNELVVGEGFQIKHKDLSEGITAYFDEEFNLRQSNNGHKSSDVKANLYWVHKLLSGECEIEKLPYIPKIGEEYWTYSVYKEPVKYSYLDDLNDILRIKNNFAFRTEEEAQDPINIARVKEYCEGVGLNK